MPFYDQFPEYVPVAERRKRAQRAADKLKATHPGIAPVRIPGRTIARTWWGKSWCDNLERYADFSNRIGRGRSYVRNGAVLDLQIAGGKATALVQGSDSQPYKISIAIAPLAPDIWRQMVTACAGKIDSLQELAAGKLPKALAELFTMKDKGLFPSPREITLACSCPDSARMCKHIAAALYGIGARLDEDSKLFFILRNANMNDLIASSVAAKSEGLLQKSKGSGRRRVIADADLSNVFGVDIDADGKDDK